jgi:hypothetical protein
MYVRVEEGEMEGEERRNRGEIEERIRSLIQFILALPKILV